MQITFEAAEKKYGKLDIATRTWADETKWMKVLILPKELCFPNWINFYTNKGVEKLYANKDMHRPLLLALKNTLDRGVSDELVSFDGLFNIRYVRGHAGRPSTHSYGLALDLNATENPLGGPVRFSKGFIECWTDAGFTAGAVFNRVDGQHFSYAWE